MELNSDLRSDLRRLHGELIQKPSIDWADTHSNGDRILALVRKASALVEADKTMLAEFERAGMGREMIFGSYMSTLFSFLTSELTSENVDALAQLYSSPTHMRAFLFYWRELCNRAESDPSLMNDANRFFGVSFYKFRTSLTQEKSGSV